jgi:hypothetical protein
MELQGVVDTLFFNFPTRKFLHRFFQKATTGGRQVASPTKIPFEVFGGLEPLFQKGSKNPSDVAAKPTKQKKEVASTRETTSFVIFQNRLTPPKSFAGVSGFLSYRTGPKPVKEIPRISSVSKHVSSAEGAS